MIAIDFPAAGVAEVRPEGALSQADFDHLSEAVNGYINEHDTVPNLLIHPHGVPHWDSLGAAGRHLRFVRDHHRLVNKVAIVGDVGLLSVLPPLADLFVGAKLRHFPERNMAAARQWVEQKEDHPGAFEIIDGLPSDVVGLRATGIITARDYRDTLIPLVEEKLKVHDKLKYLVVVDDEFISYAPEAAWDDARFGFSHWADFGRIALVTDIGWLKTATRLFAPLMPGQVHVFALDELDEAKSWIKR